MNEQQKKNINFYNLTRQEYERSNKPFVWPLDLASSKPKPQSKKLNILINKFISIYKSGMKSEYDNEEVNGDNYWSILVQKFLGRESEILTQENLDQNNFQDYHFELKFVNDQYWQKPKYKLKKYFVLLLHSKKLFSTLKQYINDFDFLYEDPEEKKLEYEREIKLVDFLKDGQFEIMGDLINQFEDYVEETQAQLKINRQRLQKQHKQRLEQERLMKIREEKQRAERELEEKKRQEDEEKRRKVEEELLEKSKVYAENAPIISDEFYPEEYRAAHRNSSKKKILDRNNAELEMPQKKENHRHKKRSQILWEEQYKEQFNTFAFNLEPEISENNTVCANPNCKKDLKTGIYIFGGNQNLCHYTGKWYCNDDMSKNRMPIPWKAKHQFDLRGYPVCKAAYSELNNYYEKPLIQIEYKSPVINNNKKLYDFLLIRRQIHLIYDSICNVDHIQAILKNRLNYCLQKNIFSLKNLYDIYNGQEIVSLDRDYQVLSRHFYRCEICQKKRGFICPKCKDQVRIYVFELKTTHGCKLCRNLYHRKCLPLGKCDCRDNE